jgi:hypothetical protein
MSDYNLRPTQEQLELLKKKLGDKHLSLVKLLQKEAEKDRKEKS